jgi:glycosyltransferase involved in cell wall biosynthesis
MGANSIPRVCVGMPVYNGERWIRESIDSILNQSYPSLDLRISDNASTDGTRAICEEYTTRDPRVRYFRNDHNVGVFRNYDLAFERCDADYFKWSAVGDICAPTFVSRCMEVLTSRPQVVLAYPQTVLFDTDLSDGRLYDDDLDLQDESPAQRFLTFLSRARLNNVMNGVIRSSTLRETALNQVFKSSDMSMIAELTLRGKIVQLSEPLYFRRAKPQTATARKNATELREFFAHEPVSTESLQTWKLEASLWRAVLHAPIPWRERARLYSYVTHRALWSRSTLMHELVDYWRKRRGTDAATQPRS